MRLLVQSLHLPQENKMLANLAARTHVALSTKTNIMPVNLYFWPATFNDVDIQ